MLAGRKESSRPTIHTAAESLVEHNKPGSMHHRTVAIIWRFIFLPMDRESLIRNLFDDALQIPTDAMVRMVAIYIKTKGLGLDVCMALPKRKVISRPSPSSKPTWVPGTI